VPNDCVRSWLTLHTVRLAAVPAAAFIAACLDRGYQTDYWQHLARGRLIAREGAVVSVDRFTYTVAGQPFQDNNWLTQLLYHALHSAGGLELVQALNAAVLAVTLALVVRMCRKASGSSGVAAVVGAVCFLGLWQTFLIRPQTFSMLLFVLLYALLRRARERPAVLVFVPLVMAVWANVHGGFAVGLALILAHAAGAAMDLLLLRSGEGRSAHLFRLLACLITAVAATLANPYGWGVYRYAGRLSAVGVERGIEEWMPPSVGSLNGVVCAASLVAAAALVLWSWRRVTWTELCIACCFAVPSFVSTRMTIWWFLAAAPIAARLAAGCVQRVGVTSDEGAPVENFTPARPSLAAGTALGLLFAACALSLPWLDSVNPIMDSVRTSRRVEADLAAVATRLPTSTAIDATRPGVTPITRRLFTRMEWANYFAWACDGQLPVFVEGHVELYPAAVWDEYLIVDDARPGWEAVLDRRKVDLLVLDRAYHGRLIDEVARSPQWEQKRREGPAVVFERRRDEEMRPGDSVAGSVEGND